MDRANTLLGLLWRFFQIIHNMPGQSVAGVKCSINMGSTPISFLVITLPQVYFGGCQKVRGLHGRREIPVFKRIPLGIYRRDRQCHCVWLSRRAAKFTTIKSLLVAGPGPNDWGQDTQWSVFMPDKLCKQNCIQSRSHLEVVPLRSEQKDEC